MGGYFLGHEDFIYAIEVEDWLSETASLIVDDSQTGFSVFVIDGVETVYLASDCYGLAIDGDGAEVFVFEADYLEACEGEVVTQEIEKEGDDNFIVDDLQAVEAWCLAFVILDIEELLAEGFLCYALEGRMTFLVDEALDIVSWHNFALEVLVEELGGCMEDIAESTVVHLFLVSVLVVAYVFYIGIVETHRTA